MAWDSMMDASKRFDVAINFCLLDREAICD
jgi:hypothetical protein